MSSQHRKEAQPRHDGIEPYPLTPEQQKLMFKDKRPMEQFSTEELAMWVDIADQMVYYYQGGGGKRQSLRRKWVEQKKKAQTLLIGPTEVERAIEEAKSLEFLRDVSL